MTQTRLISFVSVHQAIKAERVLTESGVAVTPLPTPREISASCGQCLLLHLADLDKAMKLLAQQHIQWSKLYSRDQDRVFELIAEYGSNV